MKPQIVNAKMNKLLFRSNIVKIGMFILAVVLTTMMMGSLYYRDRVYITDNGVTRELVTNETDVYAILRAGGYDLSAHDRVIYKEQDEYTSYIDILRAYYVDIHADGATISVPVLEGTAAQALDKAGIKLGEFDEVDVDLDESSYDGMQIRVTRVSYEVRESTSEIAYETEYVDNSNLVIGTERVVTAGAAGERTYYIKEKYVDGELAGQEMVNDVVTKQPVTEVIERGTASAEPYAKMDDPYKLKLVDGIPESYTRVISGKSTAYTAGYGAYTASGRKAEIGTVAVNPNVIPYGSELYIVSQDGSKVYGYAIAADTGLGMMEGTVLVDLYFGNRYEHYGDSCRWGAVYVDVYVLSEGSGY